MTDRLGPGGEDLGDDAVDGRVELTRRDDLVYEADAECRLRRRIALR